MAIIRSQLSMSDSAPPPPYSLLTDGIKPVVASAPATAMSLVNQPKLILERQTDARGRHYVIGSPLGTVLGYIEPERQIGEPSMTEFHYGVFNTKKEKLLSIERTSPFFSSTLQTRVTVHGSGNNKPVGVCKGSDRAGRRRYALSLSSQKAPFGRTDTPKQLAHEIVIVDNSGNEAASVCWAKHEKRGDKSTPRMSYELHMGPTSSSRASTLSIEQRALVLAAAIDIDYDYFTFDSRFSNPYTQGQKPMLTSLLYGGIVEVDY